MIVSRITIDAKDLAKIKPDLANRHARFAEEIADLAGETERFIVRKLTLPGLAVTPVLTRRGRSKARGTPGPAPGSEAEPVLHRDSGKLVGSVNTSWPVYPQPGRNMNLEVIISVGAPTKYARFHELGEGNNPERPFVAPAAQRFERAIPGILGRVFGT